MTAEATSDYVLFVEKLKSEHRPEDDVNQFFEFRCRDHYHAYMLETRVEIVKTGCKK